ncbi:MAG TPA: 1-acyl-sn-glycerol-3-phosphate acyltransferase [Anaerolineales bacterium]|nr:1-acyl-sn-glycerol-3-phosphate acyltransferase [Anaerolineales bacterium]
MPNIEVEIQTLTDALIFEITNALALPQSERAKRFIGMLFGKAMRRFAELGAGLDRVVAEGGVAAGARWALPRFVKSHAARGAEIIPPEGPLVIASNHPASVDSLVISAHVERRDYKIIVGDIPFFEKFPHLSQHAIYAPDPHDIHGRMRVIRACIRHLQGGGALLIFPRGGIEADPDWMPNPDGEFDQWSRSLEIFLERVPQTRVLVTVVSGVIQRTAMRNPLTWLRKNRPDRQRLAFIYQLMRQTLSGKELFGLTPRVTFGEVVEGATNKHVLAEVSAAARRTLEKHMEWQV